MIRGSEIHSRRLGLELQSFRVIARRSKWLLLDGEDKQGTKCVTEDSMFAAFVSLPIAQLSLRQRINNV